MEGRRSRRKCRPICGVGGGIEYTPLIPLVIGGEAAPNFDGWPNPAELGMAPNVPERGLSTAPKPRDD